MPDPVFEDPRLAELYDPLESDRRDLDPYAAMVEEFAARSVLDVGCGTGTLACLLAARGIEVVALDPAAASLDVARAKPHADLVRWVRGDMTTLSPVQVDLATMTGNVAQVFVDDQAWGSTLSRIHAALRPGGRLVFETRDPARQAWREWTRERTQTRAVVPGVGAVESWCDLVDFDVAAGDLVSFRWTFVFEADGAVITSDSTLRFRSREEVEAALRAAGFEVEEIRDAPDRPGLELVFVACR